MLSTIATSLEAFFDYQIGGFYAWRAAAAAALLLAAMVFHAILYTRAFGPLETVLERTDTEADDYLTETSKAPVAWLAYIVAIYLSVRTLDLPETTVESVGVGSRSAGTIVAAWLAFRVLDVGIHFLDTYTEETEATIDDQLVPVVRRIARILLVIIAALLIVQQWGYDVGTLIAGLGIGGLGFALAARNMLSNWFGALMIFTDRPFEVGDWIETDHGEGTVEEVGLRSTRIRMYGRERLVIPNAKIARAAITNSAAVDRRRVRETVGLVYDTTHQQLREVLGGIRSLLEGHDAVADDDWRVYFVGFGESALQIEISYFNADPSWTAMRETRQQLFLEIIDIVDQAGTDFAFPTRSVLLEEPPAESSENASSGPAR